jgi:hypothetical protein
VTGGNLADDLAEKTDHVGPIWELHDEPKKHGKEMNRANHMWKRMIPMNKHIGTKGSLQV